MKTFAIFWLIWLASIVLTFYAFKGASIEEMIKVVIATQLAYIIYKLAKEELKD
jgi:uncharacterized membrane protein YbhN (UPF0104 family)